MRPWGLRAGTEVKLHRLDVLFFVTKTSCVFLKYDIY